MRGIVALVFLLLATAFASAQESPNQTSVTTVGPSINASPTPGVAGSGSVLTITAGAQIALNGVTLGGANVIQLYYINHTAYQENASLNWFGPITASSTGSQVSNPVPNNASNNIPDLSNAAALPVTGFPASKIAYSVHLSPNNVSGSTPDTPLATAVAVWNAYFGNLEKNGTAPVVNLSVGCSCDNSQGQATDDTAFASNYVAYATGTASGGPSFTGSQQPMSNAWYSWGNFASQNPNGTLNADGTLKGTEPGQAGGQAFYWSQLLQGSSVGPPPPPQSTTWNPADVSAGITLSNSNTTATTNAGTTTSQSVRSTTSQTAGSECFAISAPTITSDFDVGLANSSYALTAANGLGGDTTGIGFDPNSVGALQGIFFANSVLSSGTATSANGENIMICANFSSHLLYATTFAMRAAVGSGAWNNSSSCTPTVAGCGVSFAGMSCPCYIAYNNFQPNSAALLETTTASLPFALPAGYSAWDQTVVSNSSHPIILIFGANDNLLRANDNEPRLALAERIVR